MWNHIMLSRDETDEDIKNFYRHFKVSFDWNLFVNQLLWEITHIKIEMVTKQNSNFSEGEKKQG